MSFILVTGIRPIYAKDKRQFTSLNTLYNNSLDLQFPNNNQTVLLKNIETEYVLKNKYPNRIVFKAIDLLSNNVKLASDYYYYIAKVYGNENDYNNAIKAYKLAINKNRNNSKAYKDLALIFLETGNSQKSLKYWNEYLKFAENPKEKALINKIIAEILTHDKNTIYR